jgi:hypothetical protein
MSMKIIETPAGRNALRRAALIQGLHDCASFLETHPSVSAGRYHVLNVFVDSKEEIVAHARAATWEKVYNDTWFSLVREFGQDVKLEISAPRSAVCRRIVVGETVEPARPAQTVDVVKWVCDEAVLA